MLAVECRHRLTRVKISKRNDLHFRKTERVFDHRCHAGHLGLKDTAAHDWGHLDLDLDALGAHQQLRDPILESRLGDLGPVDARTHLPCNALHGRVDGVQGGRACFEPRYK